MDYEQQIAETLHAILTAEPFNGDLAEEEIRQLIEVRECSTVVVERLLDAGLGDPQRGAHVPARGFESPARALPVVREQAGVLVEPVCPCGLDRLRDGRVTRAPRVSQLPMKPCGTTTPSPGP